METTLGTDSPGVSLKPPRIFLACLLAGAVLELLRPWDPAFLARPLGRVSGGLLALAGFAFMMWGWRRFKVLGVNVKTVLPAALLVRQGAYRFSRNPMYVGLLAILAGLGLACQSAWMALSALPMALYLGLHVIPREEAYLARRFGADYEAYRRAVRRWL